MNEFFENADGELEYAFDIDYDSPLLTPFPKPLVKVVVKLVCRFTPYALSDRSFDAQAILGALWDDGNVNHNLLGKILSAVSWLPGSPMEADPDSPKNRQRYRFFI